MNKVSEFKYSKFLNWNEYIDSMSENKENFKKHFAEEKFLNTVNNIFEKHYKIKYSWKFLY